MKTSITRLLAVVVFLFAISPSLRAAGITLTNPVLFVTQVQMPKEMNGNVSNTLVTVVSLFGNHLPDTTHAGRGGDLFLMTTNLGLVNLTRKAGFGTNGAQDKIGIGVRDPVAFNRPSSKLNAPVGGNLFTLTALAATNQPWVLETSTNLFDWLVLTTNSSAPNGVIQFSPPFNPTNSQQYFRLRSP